jgi:hypothetical protein
MKTFVVAGTYDQGMRWVKQNITDYATTHGSWRSLSDYIIVKDAISLRGHSDPHGVFVGTWRERKDLKDIVQSLMIQSTHPNPALGKIWKEL